jgi:hypothetical protein
VSARPLPRSLYGYTSGDSQGDLHVVSTVDILWPDHLWRRNRL